MFGMMPSTLVSGGETHPAPAGALSDDGDAARGQGRVGRLQLGAVKHRGLRDVVQQVDLSYFGARL